MLKEKEEEKYNQDNKKFKKLQNQIDVLKTFLYEIYKERNQSHNKELNSKNNEPNKVNILLSKKF